MSRGVVDHLLPFFRVGVPALRKRNAPGYLITESPDLQSGPHYLLPFFIVARTAAAYVAPSGLGAPRAMQAMMIASATRSALALHLAGTRARSGRDQSQIAADRRHPPKRRCDREVTGTWPGSEQGQFIASPL